MAFAKVEDLSGTAELVIFPDTFAKCGHYLKDERPLLIGGALEVNEGAVKILVDNVAPFDDILKKTKRITFRLDLLAEEQYAQLQSLIHEFKGQTEVKFLFNMDNRLVEMTPETVQHIEISDSFFEEARQLFGRTDFIEI